VKQLTATIAHWVFDVPWTSAIALLTLGSVLIALRALGRLRLWVAAESGRPRSTTSRFMWLPD
jgi:hypothetical protein